MNDNAHDNTKKDKSQIIAWLIEYFPKAFFKKGNQVRPLQIGIFSEIIDFYDRLDTPPFSKKALRNALRHYSSSPAYLKSQTAEAIRIDLFGNEIEAVTEEQAKYAQERYQKRYGPESAR